MLKVTDQQLCIRELIMFSEFKIFCSDRPSDVNVSFLPSTYQVKRILPFVNKQLWQWRVVLLCVVSVDNFSP